MRRLCMVAGAIVAALGLGWFCGWIAPGITPLYSDAADLAVDVETPSGEVSRSTILFWLTCLAPDWMNGSIFPC
jgi:hypothetical protein